MTRRMFSVRLVVTVLAVVKIASKTTMNHFLGQVSKIKFDSKTFIFKHQINYAA